MNEKLYNILGTTLGINVAIISDDLTMRDVETWDSLKHMELIATLEQAFELEFTFEEIISMQNVAEIKHILTQKGVNGKI